MAKSYFGAGWWIAHQTEREIILTKEDVLYRMLTGEDGYVRLAVGPGTPREDLYEQAERRALECDAVLMEQVSRQLLPNMQKYHMKALPLRRAFQTPEDPRIIGWKSA